MISQVTVVVMGLIIIDDIQCYYKVVRFKDGQDFPQLAPCDASLRLLEVALRVGQWCSLIMVMVSLVQRGWGRGSGGRQLLWRQSYQEKWPPRF